MNNVTVTSNQVEQGGGTRVVGKYMPGYTVDSSGSDCKSDGIASGGATPSPGTIYARLLELEDRHD